MDPGHAALYSFQHRRGEIQQFNIIDRMLKPITHCSNQLNTQTSQLLKCCGTYFPYIMQSFKDRCNKCSIIVTALTEKSVQFISQPLHTDY